MKPAIEAFNKGQFKSSFVTRNLPSVDLQEGKEQGVRLIESTLTEPDNPSQLKALSVLWNRYVSTELECAAFEGIAYSCPL